MGDLPRILIVGAGLTGSALAYRLSRAPVQLSCWDKARKIGGRMTTKSWRNQNIDIGAKFISRPNGDDIDPLFSELISDDVIHAPNYLIDQSYQYNTNNKFSQTHEGKSNSHVLKENLNYLAVNGSQSVVDYLFARSEIQAVTDMFLHKLDMINIDDTEKKVWQAVNIDNDIKQLFDAVIFTIPVPQYMNDLSSAGRPVGDYLNLIHQDTNIYDNLLKVTYFSSYSLAIFFDKSIKDLQKFVHNRISYLPENKIIKYIHVNRNDENSVSISIHSHRTWADTNIQLSKDEAKQIIYNEFLTLFNKKDISLPQPDHVICHKWRYSQTKTSYDGAPGAVKLVNQPLLIGAGDSFTVSNVGGCLQSARAAHQIIAHEFGLP